MNDLNQHYLDFQVIRSYERSASIQHAKRNSGSFLCLDLNSTSSARQCSWNTSYPWWDRHGDRVKYFFRFHLHPHQPRVAVSCCAHCQSNQYHYHLPVNSLTKLCIAAFEKNFFFSFSNFPAFCLSSSLSVCIASLKRLMNEGFVTLLVCEPIV